MVTLDAFYKSLIEPAPAAGGAPDAPAVKGAEGAPAAADAAAPTAAKEK